jgi:hypothetical protein
MARGTRRFIVCTIAASAAMAWLPAFAASAATTHPGRSAAGRPAVSRAVPSAAAAARALGQDGSLTGIVEGAAGVPLPGICVTATGTGGRHQERSSAAGRYVFTGLATGAFSVSYRDCASPDSYAAQNYPGGRVVVAAGQPTLLAPVALTPDSPALALAAEQGYARAHPATAAAETSARALVTGKVTSASGHALAGICVTAIMRVKLEVGPGQTATVSLPFVVSTGRSGSYRVPRLPGFSVSSVRVQFNVGCGNGGNYAPQWWRDAASRTKATTLAPASKTVTLSGISARLTRGATLTGIVRGGSASGAGLGGVCVRANGQGGQAGVIVTAKTASTGRYVLRGLGTGSYTVRFTACSAGNFLNAGGGSVTVKAGRSTKVNAILRPGATISGTVTSSLAGNADIAGICVGVENEAGSQWVATTSSSGGYSIDRLPAGSYQVIFTGGCGNAGSYAPQYFSSASTTGTANVALASLISVAAGGSATASSAMMPGGTVTGTVTSQSGGQPVSGACVDLIGPGPEPISVALTIDGSSSLDGDGELLTGPSGQYEADNLAPGLYLATASGCESSDYASAWFGSDGAQPEWISVSAGAATSGISVALARSGSVSGTIRSTSGHRLAGVCAIAASTNSTLQAITELAPLGDPVGVTGPSGAYRIEGLTPGRYTVVFGSCLGGPWASRRYESASAGHSDLITVRAGHGTGAVNGALSSGWAVHGHVVSAVTGKPVRGACVLYWLGSPNSEPLLLAGSQITTSGKAGQFTLPHMAAGTYQVAAGPCLSQAAHLGPIQMRVKVTGKNHGSPFVFRLPRAGAIHGTITAPGQPGGAAGTCVEITPLASNVLAGGFALVSPDGSYAAAGLAPGSYQLVIDNSCSGSTALAAETISPVEITAGDTTTQDASLVANGSFSGTVTSASPSGSLPGICVAAFASPNAASPSAVATTGADGTYQLGFLAPGSYVVEFSSGCGATGYTAQWYDGASSAGAAAAVTVTAGADQGDVGATMSS